MQSMETLPRKRDHGKGTGKRDRGKGIVGESKRDQGNGTKEKGPQKGIKKEKIEFYNKTPSHNTGHGTGAHWH